MHQLAQLECHADPHIWHVHAALGISWVAIPSLTPLAAEELPKPRPPLYIPANSHAGQQAPETQHAYLRCSKDLIKKIKFLQIDVSDSPF
jgi:hypothetical protein